MTIDQERQAQAARAAETLAAEYRAAGLGMAAANASDTIESLDELIVELADNLAEAKRLRAEKIRLGDARRWLTSLNGDGPRIGGSYGA